MGKKILPTLIIIVVAFTTTIYYNINSEDKALTFKVNPTKSKKIDGKINKISTLASDSNQKIIERASICVIDYMRENNIELLGRETLVSELHFIVLKYDFDQHLRLYLYISKEFKVGLLDSISYPNIVDQIYTGSIPGLVLEWPNDTYNLTTAISSDYLNNLPEGLVKKVNNVVPICLATL